MVSFWGRKEMLCRKGFGVEEVPVVGLQVYEELH
jgi:hypothetical protein